MVEGNLNTTNLLLGILAAVSVIEAIALVAAGYMGWRLYSQAMRTIREVEERQIAPLVGKVNSLMTSVDSILVDVKGITSRVEQQTERVNTAISQTIDRVDETADRVKNSLAYRVHRMVGVVQSMRAVFGTLFNGQSSPRRHATNP